MKILRYRVKYGICKYYIRAAKTKIINRLEAVPNNIEPKIWANQSMMNIFKNKKIKWYVSIFCTNFILAT